MDRPYCDFHTLHSICHAVVLDGISLGSGSAFEAKSRLLVVQGKCQRGPLGSQAGQEGNRRRPGRIECIPELAYAQNARVTCAPLATPVGSFPIFATLSIARQDNIGGNGHEVVEVEGVYLPSFNSCPRRVSDGLRFESADIDLGSMHRQCIDAPVWHRLSQ